MSGRCFDVVISMQFDKFFDTTKSELGLFKNNKEMREFLELYFEENSKKLSEQFGLDTEKEERTRMLELMCTYAFYRKIYPSDESRDVWKVMWESQKRIPIIEGYSYICVYISDFLTNLCPLTRPAKTRDPKDPEVFIKEYVQKIDQLVPADVNSLYTQACIWFSRM